MYNFFNVSQACKTGIENSYISDFAIENYSFMTVLQFKSVPRSRHHFNSKSLSCQNLMTFRVIYREAGTISLEDVS